MQCTLLIPHLFWPGEPAASVTAGLALPHLEKLLARAQCEREPGLPPEAWLCRAFEVERQQDWPIAALTLALDGGEPGTDYWLRADPIHLKLTRDWLMLVESALFEIDLDEARALVTTLNGHFAQSGVVFHAMHAQRWYIRLPHAPALITRMPSQAAGRNVDHFLPSGADALAWHRSWNEIQMLLHEHPVNERREARGEPAVNSVWFWGGGTRPIIRAAPFDGVWSDDSSAIALATAADVPCDAAPGNAQTWLKNVAQSDADGSHLITFEALGSAVAYHDLDAWRTRLSLLETQWIAPLSSALRNRTLERLTIVVPRDDRCLRFSARPLDLLKLWRRPASLAAYA
jgi:hypothetical protein